jgi:branched-chain amino acid transport system permease protein
MVQQLLDSVVLASIYILFSIGMSLAWGILGILNLAHGAILMFSAYLAYVWANAHHSSLVVVLLVGLFAGGLLSLLLELGPFRFIRRSIGDPDELELRVVIASIGASTILVAVAALATGNTSFGIPTSFHTHVYEIGGVRISDLQAIIIVVGFGLSGALAFWLRTSRNGRAIRAIESDTETAALMGIFASRLSSMTMFVAGAFAGLAGVLLVVYLGATEPDASNSLLTTAFAVIVIGGVGSIGGAVVGAFVLALLETIVVSDTSGVWAPAISFIFIIVVLLVWPEGLFASSRRKVDRV